jgi:hypothetical protein
MKISYRESGGFTGLSRGVEIDTATLPAADARRVEALVARAGLKGQARTGPAEARDVAGYQITIESEAGRVAVSFDDMSVPAEADDLLAFLQERAGPVPPQ